jgi:hypothetical protein
MMIFHAYSVSFNKKSDLQEFSFSMYVIGIYKLKMLNCLSDC